MAVIGAAAIGLIISFYVYVFIRFGRELRSMRKAQVRLIPWPLSRRSPRQVPCTHQRVTKGTCTAISVSRRSAKIRGYERGPHI